MVERGSVGTAAAVAGSVAVAGNGRGVESAGKVLGEASDGVGRNQKAVIADGFVAGGLNAIS